MPQPQCGDRGTPRPGKNKGGAGECLLPQPGTAWAGVEAPGPLRREGRAVAEFALQKHRPTSLRKWLVCVGSMAAGVREAQGRGCLSLASVAFREGFVLTKCLSGAVFYFYFVKKKKNLIIVEL